MGSKIGLNVPVGADISGFSTEMQNLVRTVHKTGKQIQSVGKVVSAAFTLPFAAAGALAIKNWDTQAKAIAQVEAGIKSTGMAAGLTSKQLQAMASELQNNSLFGDEQILKDVTAQLLTFTSVAGEQFAMAQQAALDLATRLDGDLKSATIMLGKALNDPVQGINAMSRAGIQFSEDQKSVIRGLVETNRMAEAQTIILKELERQYGGSAKAAADAGAGPLVQLKNAIGDIFEPFGKLIMRFIMPFVKQLQRAANFMNNLSDSTRSWILVIGGVLAAIGPLLLAVGTLMVYFPKMVVMFTALKAAMLPTILPILTVTAGVVALGAGILWVVKNGAALAERMPNFFGKMKNAAIGVLQAMLKGVQLLPDGVLKFFGIKEGKEGIQSALDGLDAMKYKVLKLTTEFKSLGSILKDAFPQIQEFAAGAGGAIVQGEDAAGGGTGGVQKRGGIIGEMQSIAISASAFGDRLAAGLSEVPEKLNTIKDGFISIGRVIDEEIQQRIDSMNAMIEAFIEDTIADLASALGDALVGGDGFKNFGREALGNLANYLSQFGKMLIVYGVGLEAIEKAITNPALAIAAGVALIATSAAIKGHLSKSSSAMTGGASSSGVASGGGTLTAVIRGGDLYLMTEEYSKRRK